MLWKPRKHWIRPGRKNDWCLSFKYNQVTPQDWHKNFRMSKESFLVLCQQLEEHLTKCNTRFWKAVSVEEKVALTLYYLSDEGRLRKTANAFGFGKSTVSAIIWRICKVTTVYLTSKYINFPKTKKEVEESSSLFNAKQEFPQCIGAIDCTHVSIKHHQKIRPII